MASPREFTTHWLYRAGKRHTATTVTIGKGNNPVLLRWCVAPPPPPTPHIHIHLQPQWCGSVMALLTMNISALAMGNFHQNIGFDVWHTKQPLLSQHSSTHCRDASAQTHSPFRIPRG